MARTMTGYEYLQKNFHGELHDKILDNMENLSRDRLKKEYGDNKDIVHFLSWAFPFYESKEGLQYWNGVVDGIRNNTPVNFV